MSLRILNLRGASGPQPPFPQPNVVPDALPVDPPFQPPFRPTPIDTDPYPPKDGPGWSRMKNLSVGVGILVAVVLIVFAAYRLGGGTTERAARLFGQTESSQEPETSVEKETERDRRVVSDSDHGEGITRYVAGETRKERDARIERESVEEVLARRQAWRYYLDSETLEQREERIRQEEQGIRGQPVRQSRQQQQEQPRDQRQTQPNQQRQSDPRQAQPQGRQPEQVELLPRR